jgi:hypothetical protein
MVRDIDKTECLNFDPVRGLDQNFVQITIEIALKEATLLGAVEQWVLTDARWHLLCIVLGSHQDRDFKLLVNLTGVHGINGILSFPVFEECLFN